jgi:hypothetical protein
MASTSNAIRMLGRLSKHADEVVEAGAKNLSEGNIIKATTTQLSSNMTNKQKQVVARIGREAAENARNTGRQAANASMSHKTAQNAMNRVNNGKVVADNIAHAKTVNGAAIEMGAAGANIRRGAIEASRNQLNYNTTGNAIKRVRNTVDEGFIDPARTGGRDSFRTLNRAQQELALTTDDVGKNRRFGQQHHDYVADKIDRNNKGRSVWQQMYKKDSPWARGNVRGEAVDIPQSARAELDFAGDAGQVSRTFGKGQGTVLFPDTVPMDISGDIQAIEDMTGSKFKTKTIKGNAHRETSSPYVHGTNFKIDDNGNKIPLAGPDNTIYFNTVPADFIGDVRQLERTTGSTINSFEIPDTRTPNFGNTNYMNVNPQPQTSAPKFQSNPVNRSMNILQNQQQRMQNTIGLGQPNIGFNSSMKTNIPQMDMSKVKNFGDVDQIKDVNALNTMLNEDTRAPIDMAKAWSSIKDFGNEYMIGGIRDTITGMQGGKGFQDAVKGAFTDADNNIRWGRVAGTYVTASAGLRLLSGGGLTRDRNGNPNMIGVPFI